MMATAVHLVEIMVVALMNKVCLYCNEGYEEEQSDAKGPEQYCSEICKVLELGGL
jgi:hypothetical protein